MSKPFIEPGPVPGTVINSPGELDAMVSSAQPAEDHGMTYRGDTAPDIATYSIYENFLWIDTSGPRIIRRHYNADTFAWDAELPADGSITGDMIADNTITLAKIYATPGLGGYVMRLNAGSTAVVWDAPVNLYGNDEFPITKLEYSAAGSYVLSSNGTTNSWATVISLISAGSIALSKIDTTGAAENKGLFYYSAALGWQYVETMLRDNMTPLNKLELGAANTIPVINSAGTAWTMLTPSQFLSIFTGLINQTNNTPDQDIPAAAGGFTYDHNVGSVPRVEWFLVCRTADLNFAVGDEVPVSCIGSDVSGTDDQYPLFVFRASATTLYCRRASSGAIYLLDATSGVLSAITESSWKFKAYYTK
jgi:hypothetical protein